MKEPVINYLDIQLRNMDYLNEYNSIQGKFLDTENKYQEKEPFHKGFIDAFNIASKSLNQTRDKGGKIRTKSIQSLFLNLYKERLKKEQDFIRAWLQAHPEDKSIAKISFPAVSTKMPKSEKSFSYAMAFSNFLNQAIGNNLNKEDQIIVRTLRDADFIEQVSGLRSAVFSSRAVEQAQKNGAKARRDNQSLINSYYEDLFNIFCLGDTTVGDSGQKIRASFNLEDALDKLKKDSTSRKIFRLKFKQFLNKYYPEISEKVSLVVLGQLRDRAFKNIYENFKNTSKNSKIIITASLEGRGVSYENEQQLKKMFLETFRQISSVKSSGLRYEDLSVSGLIEINEKWEVAGDRFNKSLQIKINDLMERFNKLDGPGSEKDRRRNKVIQNEIMEFSNFYFDWLVKKIELWNQPFKISDKAKANLRHATLSKLSGVEGWGSKMLKKLSAFGPSQVRGLLGEIATAYSIQLGMGLNTEITGALQSSTGTGQLHYDIQAIINNDLKIGFQVKNYKTEKTVSGLYSTSIGLGTSAMNRYFKADDIRNYRWLFANGLFLSKKSGSPKFNSEASLKKKISESFISAIPYFLRIGDAANGEIEEQINSDIYVIGNYYYPASYLIERAYSSAIDEKKNASARILSIEGAFPQYAEKYLSVNRKYGTEYFQKRDKETGQWVNTNRLRTKQKIINSGSKTSYERDNLVYISEHNRLTQAKINFAGITISFKI